MRSPWRTCKAQLRQRPARGSGNNLADVDDDVDDEVDDDEVWGRTVAAAEAWAV